MRHQSALKFAILASAFLACAARGQDYFPLQTGNVWVYKASGTRPAQPLTVEIVRSEQIDGVAWYLLRWSGRGDYWLRQTGDGVVVELDPATKEEKVWYRFNSRPGEVYTTAIPSCCGRAMVSSRNASYEGILGRYPALEITYPGVFQVGIDRELFIPYVGMVFRHENTGGPSFVNYDLSYARIGGVTVVQESSLSATIALDRPSYPPDGRVRARFSVRNTSPNPIELRFPSTQLYNLAIRNSAGQIVYNWAADKLFAAVVQVIRLGERDFWIEAPLPNLPPGAYTAEAWLTASNYPERAFSARAAFQVVRPTVP